MLLGFELRPKSKSKPKSRPVFTIQGALCLAPAWGGPH